MTMYSGREFSLQEIEQIRQLMQQNPTLLRTPPSRKLCELFAWTKPNGELKDMSCRVALLRMQAHGLITLPASRMPHRGRPHFPATAATDAQAPLLRPVHELATLTLQPVLGPPASRLWNEYVQRYHYLGYTSMSGSQMRYNVFAGEQLVALLSFGASAWKLGPREQFIGWPEPMRLKNLQRVVNNARFLILPWIQSKGLASKRPVQGSTPTSQGLAAALRLSPGLVRDLRGDPAPSRHLLQGSQLGAHWTDHRPRQEIRRPPSDHPDQGHGCIRCKRTSPPFSADSAPCRRFVVTTGLPNIDTDPTPDAAKCLKSLQIKPPPPILQLA